MPSERTITQLKTRLAIELSKSAKGAIPTYEEKTFLNDPLTDKGPKETLTIKDKNGRTTSLSNYQKNALYSQAKDLREKISRGMLTKTEAWRADSHDCHLMKNREWSLKEDMTKYNKIMRALGADPKECSTEELRRKI